MKSQERKSIVSKVEDLDPHIFMVQNIYETVFLNEEGMIPKKFNNQENNNDTWYLANGASNHMKCNLSFFTEHSERIKGRVKFGDDSFVEIHGKYSIFL